MRPTRTSLQPAGLASNPVPTTTVCADLADPTRCFAIRGRVVKVTAEGGAEHIEALAQRSMGAPHPWYRSPLPIEGTCAP